MVMAEEKSMMGEGELSALVTFIVVSKR